MKKGRLAQVRKFVEKAKTAEKEPAQSAEEIRYRITLGSLAPNLQESIVKITHLIFRKEFSDYPESPEQYPERFYRIGNVALAYLADKMPDVIEPFESKELPWPEEEEAVIQRARVHSKMVLEKNQDLISKNPDAFKLLDVYIDLFRQGRKWTIEAIENLGVSLKK